VQAPHGASPEDQLLVQFQGMIAEYERAQILERSRRGKRHRAHSGEISVMSGAPYGYRYVRKTDEAPAAYSVLEAEAGVVRRVYEMYTVEGLSIGEITRRINAEGIPTRKVSARWERSTVWAVLRNSAYRGVACFGKTRVSARTRVIRPQRRRGVTTPNMTAGHERPREEWIEIPVPALVSEDRFARAQELLQENILPHLDAHQRAQDPLLQVYWLRWLAQAGRSHLRQPPLGPTATPRSDRLGRGDPTSGRPDSDTARTGPPAGSSALIRSDQET
jgi:site-specific DNA recombinase